MAQSNAILHELDELLVSLQKLKPPGVGKSRVDAITKICTSNENLNIPIVDTLINAFKRSPNTHKLGILYCTDSVVRQWIARGGVNNAGVQKLTDSLPSLMDELLATAPADQKDKISKLIDIWLGSKTFSSDLLNSFKQRLNAPSQAPNGTQAHHNPTPTNAHNYAQPTAVAPQGIGISNTAPQPQYTTPNPYAAAPAVPYGVQGQIAPIQAPVNQYSQPVNPAPPQQSMAVAQNQLASVQNGQAPVPAAAPQDKIQILQQLVSMNPNITPEQLTQIIHTLGIPMPAMPAPAAQQIVVQPPVAPPVNQAYSPYAQDPQAYRDRSRSPDPKRRRVSPPNGRQSPTYAAYDPSASKAGTARGPESDRRERGRGRGRDNYRKRTPPRERPASPGMMSRSAQQNLTGAPKPVGTDYNLGTGRIKVLSRTLFIGGVKSADENELMAYISQFSRVQSCIVNHDKRHAFLKLISHEDAIQAKRAIDSRPETEYRHLFERMNWAVGFGPTQFADYKLGESVLPIDVLTDADCKWLKTAEYGGTGGLDIAQGMIVEEPDIEIGAGPSSKAISRRGGKAHGGGGRGGNDNFQRRDRGERDNRRFEDHPPPRYRPERQAPPPMETHMPEPVNIAPPPPVPTFGGAIPGFPYPVFQR